MAVEYMVQKYMVEKYMVEKYMVGKYMDKLVEDIGLILISM